MGVEEGDSVVDSSLGTEFLGLLYRPMGDGYNPYPDSYGEPSAPILLVYVLVFAYVLAYTLAFVRARVVVSFTVANLVQLQRLIPEERFRVVLGLLEDAERCSSAGVELRNEVIRALKPCPMPEDEELEETNRDDDAGLEGLRAELSQGFWETVRPNSKSNTTEA
ncbi:MAG: hypothetical protein AB7S38_11485 [Vulcanimicrobiota bacterium]